MKNLLLIGLFLITAFSFAQDIKATTEDGKKVVLKPNKTWSFDNSKSETKNLCISEVDFKEPKYNKSSTWKRVEPQWMI